MWKISLIQSIEIINNSNFFFCYTTYKEWRVANEEKVRFWIDSIKRYRNKVFLFDDIIQYLDKNMQIYFDKIAFDTH